MRSYEVRIHFYIHFTIAGVHARCPTISGNVAPSYYDIGLQLDIVNSQLKLIKNNPSLSDLKEKCRKMLEVWLENDTSATWKKLCDALEEVEQSIIAEEIKTTLR